MQPAPHDRRTPHRRGLAPLEFVLSLPIMLFVMGLIMVLGTAAAWKVRAHMTSREVMWRNLPHRSNTPEVNPRNWPDDASMVVRNDSNDLLATDPLADHPVVRGPVLVTEGGLVLPVQNDILDARLGSRFGDASVTRDYPVMRRVPPHEFTMKKYHPLLGGSSWSYRQMNHERGDLRLHSNLTRRIPILYNFDLEQERQALAAAYVDVALQLVLNPDLELLTPLEGGDPEIYELIGRRSPDFQPQIPIRRYRSTIDALGGRWLSPSNGESQPGVIRATYIEDLLDRIDDVPDRMKNYYINTYQAEIDRLEDLDPQPPGAAATIARLQRQIDQLRSF